MNDINIQNNFITPSFIFDSNPSCFIPRAVMLNNTRNLIKYDFYMNKIEEYKKVIYKDIFKNNIEIEENKENLNYIFVAYFIYWKKESSFDYLSYDSMRILLDIIMFENQISLSKIKYFYKKVHEKEYKIHKKNDKYDWNNTLRYYIIFYSPFKYYYENINMEANNLLELLYLTNVNKGRSNYININIPENKTQQKIIPTLSNLLKNGIKVKLKQKKTFTDIEYDEKTSTIKLPQIYVYHYRSEIVFKNLLAYEISKRYKYHPIRDYVLFMDYIIDTEEDVQILIDEKIIINKMGNNKSVANLFNNLSKGFSTEINENIFNIMENINIRYNNKIYNLKSIFINTYFDDYIKSSVSIVAFMIVICTILQTIFTIIK